MADGSFSAMDRADKAHRQRIGARDLAPSLKGRAAFLSGEMLAVHEMRPALESRYLVKGWIDRGELSVVYGESNVGKTFFALDMAMHVAAGHDWHGHRVPSGSRYAGSVFYIAGEGGHGIRNRIEAIRRERPDLIKAAGDGDFILLPVMLDLTGSDDAEHLIKALQDREIRPSDLKTALIVIDTLAMAFGGGDENTAKDMGVFVQNCRIIRAATGAHVMIIHHSGKDSTRGARGSNALRGAADTEIELTRDGDFIIATQHKQRESEKREPWVYTLRKVFIGKDEDGDPVTSCVVEASDAKLAKRAPRLKGQALIAMQAFGDALKEHGETKTGEDFPRNRQCVSLDRWREACDRHALTDGSSEGAARQAFGRAWKGLQEKGLIRVLDGFAWRCADA